MRFGTTLSAKAADKGGPSANLASTRTEEDVTRSSGGPPPAAAVEDPPHDQFYYAHYHPGGVHPRLDHDVEYSRAAKAYASRLFGVYTSLPFNT